MIYLFIAIYFLCGILGAGIAFADFQGEFPNLAKQDYRRDLGFAYLFTFLGPIWLFGVFFMSGFCQHGIKFK